MHFLVLFALIGVCLVVAPLVFAVAFEVLTGLWYVVKWLLTVSSIITFVLLVLAAAYDSPSAWGFIGAMYLFFAGVVWLIHAWPAHHPVPDRTPSLDIDPQHLQTRAFLRTLHWR